MGVRQSNRVKGSIGPVLLEQDNPVRGRVWRRINWYVAWPLETSQTKCLGVKCLEASSGSAAQAAPRTHFHLIHHSLDNNTEPSWTWLVVASFIYLTLIMQSDGCAGMVFTLNPRLRCAGTSGIQLHHNWTTLVRQNAIYTSMVLKPDTFHPIRLWNSQRKMIYKRWNWLSVHTRCRIIDHFDWRWMVTF